MPTSIQTILGTICKDGIKNDSFLHSRGFNSCETLNHHEFLQVSRVTNDLVFVFQIPLPREGKKLDFSRWHQSLRGFLQVDILYNPMIYADPKRELTLDLRLAYNNQGDPETDWTPIASSVENRDLVCRFDENIDNKSYQCNIIPIFKLSSLHHDYYLLNVRIPVDEEQQQNVDIGQVLDLHLASVYQNGGFTKVMTSLKSVFFVLVIATTVWFWNRIRLQDRKGVLLEDMLIYLGIALTVFNRKLTKNYIVNDDFQCSSLFKFLWSI